MSDNENRFKIILNSLKSFHPQIPQGNAYRHLVTLAALINGIIGSKSCQLPAVAAKVPFMAKLDSIVKKFSRWLQNDNISYETYFLPYISVLLNCISHQTLAIVFDASIVGQNCITLMASVIYKKRALPLCWFTLRGIKGHLSETIHIKLAQQLKTIIPSHATVVFLGDGEFDGENLIKTIYENKWFFVTRTAKNRIMIEDDEPFRLAHIDRCFYEEHFFIPNIRYNKDSNVYFNVIMWHGNRHIEPIFLITNVNLAREAMYWYKKRFLIETMFSDQKSRGFNIQKSHLSDCEKLNSLLIASCLAYILIIYFGILALNNNWNEQFHRKNRCDLSLFQLGIRAIDFQLNQKKKLKFGFQLSLFQI